MFHTYSNVPDNISAPVAVVIASALFIVLMVLWLREDMKKRKAIAEAEKPKRRTTYIDPKDYDESVDIDL